MVRFQFGLVLKLGFMGLPVIIVWFKGFIGFWLAIFLRLNSLLI